MRRLASLVLIALLAQLGIGQGLHVAHVISAHSSCKGAEQEFDLPVWHSTGHDGSGGCLFCAGGPLNTVPVSAASRSIVSTPASFNRLGLSVRPTQTPTADSAPRAPPSRS